MKTVQALLDEVQALGIKFHLEGDKLGVKAAKGVLTDALRRELSARKAEIMAYLQPLQAPAAAAIIPVVTRNQPLPLSFSQQRLWLLHQLADQKQVYNIPCIWRLQGALAFAALETSLNQIITRHENLRTVFVERDGTLVQKILPTLTLTLGLLAVDGASSEQLDAHVRRLIDYPFTLEREPLLQATLLRVAAQEHLLVLNLHHIIADGWSLDVLVSELATLYTADVQGQTPALPTLPIQYADFAHWQRQAMQQGDYARQLDYWQQQLADAPALLNLAADRARPPQQRSKGAVYEAMLPEGLVAQLKTLAMQTDTTLFMVLQAAFAVLLARYSGQDDILLGSPIANRNRLETEGLIGCFINTLVLRTRLEGNPTFRELLAQVRKTTLDAYQHQDLPFDVLVETLHPERTTSHSPLFQVMLVLQNTRAETLQLLGLTASLLPAPSDVSAFDLTLSLQETPDGLVGVWEYATALFDTSTIKRMVAHWQVLLTGVVDNPQLAVAALPLLTAAEQQLVLHDWNATATAYPREVCLHELFAQQAAQTPDAPAVLCTGQSLSYRELNAQANALAFTLLQQGVQPDDLIGVCVERSLETSIAVLGVLKAGAAYLPLDPNYPPERISYMLDHAKVKVLLTQSPLAQRFTQYHDLQVLCLDPLELAATSLDCPEPYTAVDAEHLAYVIYTSGSTGLPKGVMIPHRALVNRALALADSYTLNPQDRVLQFAAFSFDVAAEEMFPTWLRGGCVVVAPRDCTQSVAELVRFVGQEQVSILNLPAPYWHEWVVQLANHAVPESVRLVVAGSDKVLKARLKRWQQHTGGRVPVYCGYGPTETTITATLYTGQDTKVGLTDSVLIGRPLPDTQTYILDRHRQPVPVGVPGELHIGGIALARGYLHRDDLTAETFIANPFVAEAGSRLYKTGDLVRYLPDGTIEFLGRIDEQVKIRGFRIELGEIAAVLQQHPAVQEAVVLAKDKASGHKYLVAYVVACSKAEVIPHPAFAELQALLTGTLAEQAQYLRRELREFVQQHLPDYMVPSAFVLLDAMPLSPSGKLNSRALPEPAIQADTAHVALRTPTDITVAGIWQELLQVNAVGAFDSFFDLGGHSLLITHLLHSVSQAFHVDLPVRSLFDFPTLAAFAEHIDHARAGLAGTVKAVDFQAEVWLDDDIVPATADFRVEKETLQTVFLTGATGFVGAFLLHELLQQTPAQLYCLVRANDEAAGLQRLQQSLAAHGLWQEAYRPRLIPVLGDLGLPRFGLTLDDFALLAQQIDVIYHNGAWVNHVYPYSVLKAANVGGTQEAIRLACHYRTKPLHFISSLSVFAPEVTEMYEDADLGSPELLENGYVETKWVADKIVSLAGQRGLPVTIHRVSGVAGMLAQGGFTLVKDNFYRAILTAVQLGIGLDSPLGEDNFVPADYACQAIVYLSSQRHLLGKTFHVGNPQNTRANLGYKALLGLGYNIRLLPPKQWQTELLRRAKDDPEIGLHPLLSLFTHYDFEREPEHILFDGRNTLAGLADSGMTCPVVGQASLAAYFAWLAQQGYLPLPPVGTLGDKRQGVKYVS
ncbi:MAG: amino acid adenylation domain-containing protein [Thiothrix litoralis]